MKQPPFFFIRYFCVSALLVGVTFFTLHHIPYQREDTSFSELENTIYKKNIDDYTSILQTYYIDSPQLHELVFFVDKETTYDNITDTNTKIIIYSGNKIIQSSLVKSNMIHSGEIHLRINGHLIEKNTLVIEYTRVNKDLTALVTPHVSVVPMRSRAIVNRVAGVDSEPSSTLLVKGIYTESYFTMISRYQFLREQQKGLLLSPVIFWTSLTALLAMTYTLILVGVIQGLQKVYSLLFR